jgi:hypothetical protein
MMLVTALLVGAAPLMPAAAASSQAAATAPAAPDKLICKRNKDYDTGSNLRRGSSRVCKKASVWKAEEDELRQDLDSARESGSVEAPPSPAQGPNPAPQ